MSVDAGKIQEKVCATCAQTKPVSSFYKHKDRADGLGSNCISCVKQKKNKSLQPLTRVDEFLQSKRKLSELTDDEIFNKYIIDDDGKPVLVKPFHHSKSLQNAWSRETSSRLNEFMVDKTPRALEVMYEIMNSDLVEPGDRITAAKFIIERTLGKNPDIILTGKVNEAPYIGVLDSIVSGSREDYRKSIESVRIEDRGLDSGARVHSDSGRDGVLDVEVVEERKGSESQDSDSGENVAGGDNGSNGIGSQLRVGEDSRIDNLEQGISDSATKCVESSDGSTNGIAARVQEQKDLKARAKEITRARNEAKRRRFAARAVGATTTQDLPFLIEWKIIDDHMSKDFGKFKMKLIHPKNITERVLARVEESNDPERHAAALERAAARLAAKLSS